MEKMNLANDAGVCLKAINILIFNRGSKLLKTIWPKMECAAEQINESLQVIFYLI